MGFIALIENAIDGLARAIIFHHCVNRRRVVYRAIKILKRFVAFVFARRPVPCVRLRKYSAFRARCGLRKEKPMPPCMRKVRVASRKCFADRNRIENRESRNHLRVVHCSAKRHICAAIVTDYSEMFVSQRAHHVDAIPCHSASNTARGRPW